MSFMFVFSIFMLICIFGSFILAGVTIWALATKKDVLPRWGKVVLWLMLALSALIIGIGGIGVALFMSNFVIW
ncbi:hypothetical protein [Anaerotignum sp.]|uniref:hypothetical protein n=1 Tax=Anaerotignum sp. TaxID=2039241 RepID=UPI00332AF8F4